MITYKWKIEKLTISSNAAVTHAHWLCEGTDGVNTAACSGIRDLILGDTFTPYGQLTEQQVISWCHANETTEIKDKDGKVVDTIVKSLKDEAEQQIAGQIARQLTQKESHPVLPWAA